MNAKEHYQQGNIAEAIAAAVDEVKRHPTDLAKRGFLCELLCFSGDLKRADSQLDLMAKQDPEAMLGIAMFRQLVRAAMDREEFHQEGRLPEFLDKPPGYLQLYLEASIRLREQKPAEAVELLAKAEAERPPVAGKADGVAFDDMRDVDDLTAAFFEVFTSNGKYYWVPMNRVELIEFHPLQRPRDLLWRRAHMLVHGGPDGEVFLPTLYANTAAETDDGLRLGRATEWRGGEDVPNRGIGQRMFLVGEHAQSILEMKEIVFSNPQKAPEVETDDGESSN